MSTTTRPIHIGGPPREAGTQKMALSPLSPRRRRPSTRSLLQFWVWIIVALLGEMGLLFFSFGPMIQAVFHDLAAVLGRAPTADGSWFPVVQWTGFALSALMLVIGLRGLGREQEAGRREAESWDDTTAFRGISRSEPGQAA